MTTRFIHKNLYSLVCLLLHEGISWACLVCISLSRSCTVWLQHCIETAQKHETHYDLYMVFLRCKYIHTVTNPEAAEKSLSHHFKVSAGAHVINNKNNLLK